MISYYIRSALRDFTHNRIHALACAVVLALGVFCAIATYVFFDYLNRFDEGIRGAQQVRVVHQTSSASASSRSRSSYPLADQLRADFSGVLRVARYAPVGEAKVVAGNQERTFDLAFSDQEFLDVIPLDLFSSNANQVLLPGTALLTETAAHTLFGTTDVTGRTITVSQSGTKDLTISGVLEDIPPPSLFRSSQLTYGFEVLVAMDEYSHLTGIGQELTSNWLEPLLFTFVRLPDSPAQMRESALNASLRSLGSEHVPSELGIVSFEAKPLSTILIDTLHEKVLGTSAPAVSINALLWLLTGLVLITASLNFVNLETARLVSRAKAIAISKTSGAAPWQITLQALAHTATLTCSAVAVAVGASWISSKIASTALDVPLSEFWISPSFWLFVAALVGLLCLVAGAFPAIALSRIHPARALRSDHSSLFSRSRLRTVLVAAQFSIASFLVFVASVTFAQNSLMRAQGDERFSGTHVALLPSIRLAGQVPFDTLASELLKSPYVTGVTGTSHYPWVTRVTTMPHSRNPGDATNAVTLTYRNVAHNYFDVLGIRVLAGRDFDAERYDADRVPETRAEYEAQGGRLNVIINDVAARRFGWQRPQDAIGQGIYPRVSERPYEVVGVVESVPLTIEGRDSDAYVYSLSPRGAWTTIVRIAPNDASKAIGHIEAVWRTLAPDLPFSYRFLDEAFLEAYSVYSFTHYIFGSLSIFALGIAVVGIYGLITFLAFRRTREIGIRKVYGGRFSEIVLRLVWRFSKVLMASAIAVLPLAYIVSDRYLSIFSQRIAPGIALPILVLLFMLLLAWLSIVPIAWKAASAHPVSAMNRE